MAFPPVRTFVLSPTYWHSLGVTPVITLGEAFDTSYFPLANLTDGLDGPAFKFATTSAGVELPITDPVNVLGILNHNLDPSVLVEVYLDGVLQPRTFSVRYPTCWIDLRAFAPGFAEEGVTPAASVGIKVYGNSKPVNLSEIVVGQAYAFAGLVEVPFSQMVTSPSQRHLTEGRRKMLEWGSGVQARSMRLTLPLVNADDYALLQEVTAATAAATELTPAFKVPVVPSTRQNDMWLVHWPARMPAVKSLGDLAALQFEFVEDVSGVMV